MLMSHVEEETHQDKENKPFKSLAEIEREHIQTVLDEVGGNKSKASRILGISRKTLREKLKTK